MHPNTSNLDDWEKALRDLNITPNPRVKKTYLDYLKPKRMYAQMTEEDLDEEEQAAQSIHVPGSSRGRGGRGRH